MPKHLVVLAVGTQSWGLLSMQSAGSAKRTQSAWWGVHTQWVGVAEGTLSVWKG